MPRRYTEVSPVRVSELLLGDEVLVRRRAVAIMHFTDDTGEARIEVTWDDGTVETFDPAQEPAIEVVMTKDDPRYDA